MKLDITQPVRCAEISTEKKFCAYCAEILSPSSAPNPQKYCSAKCRKAYQKCGGLVEWGHQECKSCKGLFLKKSLHNVFCGDCGRKCTQSKHQYKVRGITL